MSVIKKKGARNFNWSDYQPSDMAHAFKDQSDKTDFAPNTSSKVDAIIIIKPEDPKYLNNPVKIAKAIKNSPFSKYDLININKRKNLIAVTVNDTKDTIARLVEVTLLGTIPVKCLNKLERALPAHRIGVIHPVSTDLSTEDIKPLIKPKVSSLFEIEPQILSVERLTKKIGLNYKDTASIKVTFEGSVLPPAVTILHSNYKVKPFVSPPLQCYNCQRMGHTAKTCKSQVRCMLCAGPHKKNECTVSDETEYKC